MSNIKVLIGFTADGSSAPFFTLDDAVQGVLDDPRWVLGGGEGLVDVSAHVRRVSLSRGKSGDLSGYTSGSCSVQFNNNLRFFDPTYTASPYFGQLVPKRQLVITVDDEVQFTGQVEDWDVDYDLSGMSIATCSGSDTLSQLANLFLTDYLPDSELTGVRINGALDNVSWPADSRDIADGQSVVVDQIVDDGTNVWSYIQNVAVSEPGQLYATKDGRIKFTARDSAGSSGNIVFGNDGIDISSLSAIYGAELLYNRVTLTNSTSSFTAEDSDSILAYGARDLTIDTYLENDTDLEPIANLILSQYKNPEYRFDQISVMLDSLSPEEQASILSLDLGQFVTVKFTPSGIPPEIVRYGKVIRIEQEHNPSYSMFSIGLQTSPNPVFILDDPLLGKLDTGVLAY